MWQDRILSQLLSSLTLERMHDAELKAAADADALTTAELLERLTKAVYSEVESTEGRRVHATASRRSPACGATCSGPT